MKSLTILVLTAALLCNAASLQALSITDSTTSNKGNLSTYASLAKTTQVTTSGYQNAMGIPVGTVIAWPASVAMNSYDNFKYLECNGQTFDTNKYPELYDVLKTNRVPNLNNQFLRGTTNTATVLKTVNDSIATHYSYLQDTHVTARLVNTDITSNLRNTNLTANLTNTALTANLKNTALTANLKNTALTANLANTAVSGTAAGQSLSSGKTSHNLRVNSLMSVSLDRRPTVNSVSGEGIRVDKLSFVYDITHNRRYEDVTGQVTLSGYASDSALKNAKVVNGSSTGNLTSGASTGNLTNGASTGNLTNGTSTGSLTSGYATGSVTNGNVTGTLDSSQVKYTGSRNPYTNLDETAPMHTFVRYFIKAIP